MGRIYIGQIHLIQFTSNFQTVQIKIVDNKITGELPENILQNNKESLKLYYENIKE